MGGLKNVYRTGCNTLSSHIEDVVDEASYLRSSCAAANTPSADVTKERTGLVYAKDGDVCSWNAPSSPCCSDMFHLLYCSGFDARLRTEQLTQWDVWHVRPAVMEMPPSSCFGVCVWSRRDKEFAQRSYRGLETETDKLASSASRAEEGVIQDRCEACRGAHSMSTSTCSIPRHVPCES